MAELDILILINTNNRGGAENVAICIRDNLSKYSYNTKLIAIEDGKSKNKITEKLEFLLPKQTTNINVLKFIDLWAAAYKLKQKIKGEHVKVVQSHTYRSNCVNLLAKVLGSNHKVQIVNHSSFSRYNKNISGKSFLKIIKMLYHYSDDIILISKAMLSDFKKYFGDKILYKTKVINNPYEIDQIIVKSMDEKVLIDYNLNDIDFEYIFFLGRLIDLKRVADIIEAYDGLKEILIKQNIQLFIAGEGEERGTLSTLVKSLKLQDHIKFLGSVKNPFPLIKKAKFLVLSSETEGFPNVLIEAMACSCPVISSDCISGPREILDPGIINPSKVLNKWDDIQITKYGILYPVGNIDMLMKAVMIYISDNELMENYKSDIQERAYDFDVSRIIPSYVKSIINLELKINKNQFKNYGAQ